ncbi:MAG: hypothetical protein HQL58_10000 [Magnetococcales bacterium]|nr:hypothetical protein [Magnetococcales bacterium]
MKTIILAGLAIVTVAILTGIPDAASVGNIYQVHQANLTEMAKPEQPVVTKTAITPVNYQKTGGESAMPLEYRRSQLADLTQQRAILNPVRVDDLSNRRYQIQIGQESMGNPTLLAEQIRSMGYRVVQTREPNQAVAQLFIDGFRSREEADRAVYLLRRQINDIRFVITPVASL